MNETSPSKKDGSKAKLSVLSVLEQSNAEQTSLMLSEEGWTVIRISSTSEMSKYNPKFIRCILVDSARKPLSDEVLAFCEHSESWRNVPKVLIAPQIIDYTNMIRVPPHAVPEHLVSYLRTTQVEYTPFATTSSPAVDFDDRRRHYRQRCCQPIPLRQIGVLLDISADGAALEMPYGFPGGTKISLHVNENVPLLRLMDAEVLSSNRRKNNTWLVHVRFLNITTAIERAMQQYILSLQIRRM